MKLTNEMRETFVNAVMAATKIKSKWPKEAVIAEIDKRLKAAAPEEVREFDKKFPGMLSQESICLDWLKTCEFRNNGKERWWSYGYVHGYRGIGISLIDVTDLQKLLEKHKEEMEKRSEMRDRLMQIAKEMTTDEQLAAALPKLVKFIPKPVVKVKAGLPVPLKSIQDDLVKMGLEVGK